jgi:hypothetical protein
LAVSRQSELFDRASECERLMNLASDTVKKQTFKQLRDMWIALANESTWMPEHLLTKEIAAIENIQSTFDGGTNKSTH